MYYLLCLIAALVIGVIYRRTSFSSTFPVIIAYILGLVIGPNQLSQQQIAVALVGIPLIVWLINATFKRWQQRRLLQNE